MHEETETGWFMPDWTVRDASLHGCNNRLHNSVKWDALWLNGSDALVLTKCASCRCRCSWQATADRSCGHLILTEYLRLFMLNKIREKETISSLSRYLVEKPGVVSIAHDRRKNSRDIKWRGDWRGLFSFRHITTRSANYTLTSTVSFNLIMSDIFGNCCRVMIKLWKCVARTLMIIRGGASSRNAQKFINVELLCDGRKIQRGRRAAPASRSKNNGMVRIECGRVRKLRTAKNAEKSKKPGNRGEWSEDGWNGVRG